MNDQMVLPFALHERGTFERFIAGHNGELVGRLRSPCIEFECLWLFGEPGVGKTHLLQAVCHEQRDAAYIPAAEMDAAAGSLDAYGRFATVAVDDVTYWMGGEASERRFMALYNALGGLASRLVLTADRSPRDVDFALADLGSRLRAAACYRVASLDDEDKLRLLAGVAGERGLDLPEDVAQFLLARTRRGQRELLGMLDRLDEASLAQGRRLTIPFVKKTLAL